MWMKMTRKYIRHLKETCEKVLNLPDSPRKIALGVAMGTALDFLPIPIISIPISYVLAKIFKVNAAATVLTVIFFKWAVPFFFALNYYTGSMLLWGTNHQYLSHRSILSAADTWIGWIKVLGYPFMLGAVVNSLVAGAITYFAVKALLEYRNKNRKIISVRIPPKNVG